MEPRCRGTSDSGRPMVGALAQDAPRPQRPRLRLAVLPAGLGDDPGDDLGDPRPRLVRARVFGRHLPPGSDPRPGIRPPPPRATREGSDCRGDCVVASRLLNREENPQCVGGHCYPQS